jgi:hypothetical protein
MVPTCGHGCLLFVKIRSLMDMGGNRVENNFVDKTPDLFYLDKAQRAIITETPESVCETAELETMISQTLPLYGDSFRMHVDGYKYKEIAEKLDKPIGTIKNRIFMARRDIKNMVETGQGFKVDFKTNFVKSNTFEPMELKVKTEIVKFRKICNSLIKNRNWNKNTCVKESKISWPTFQQLMNEEKEYNFGESVMDRVIVFNKVFNMEFYKDIEGENNKSMPENKKPPEKIEKEDLKRDAIQSFIKSASFWELMGLAMGKVPEGITIDVHYKKE